MTDITDVAGTAVQTDMADAEQNLADRTDSTDADKWERQQLEPIYKELGLTCLWDAGSPVGFWPAVKPGQDLVVAGCIGLGGTVWMARHKADILRKTLPKDYVESGRALLADVERVSASVPKMNTVVTALEMDIGTSIVGANTGIVGIDAVYPVIRGGIFAALWEFARAAGTGIYTRMKDIPVRQQTIEFCEVFDLNPYQLLSGGCLLMAVENGCDALFRMSQAGIPCSVIGKVTKGRDRVVAHDDTCRYLTRPRQDEILKLL